MPGTTTLFRWRAAAWCCRDKATLAAGQCEQDSWGANGKGEELKSLRRDQAGSGLTYRLRTMQHPNAEIPQQQSAVVTNTPEPISPLVAPPGIERHSRYPGVVALTARDDLPLREGPDRYEVILSAGHDVLAVRRPADADQAAVVASKDIQYPESS